MGIVGIVSTLTQVVPAIAGWIGGDKAEKTATEIADVARAVTGQDDPQKAVDAILADPEQARKFHESILNWRIEKEREETKRIQTINETMRRELTAGKWKGGWRPWCGYVFGTSWGVLVFGIIWLLHDALDKGIAEAVKLATAIGTMLAQITPLFGMMMAVLGVAVLKRSSDKQLTAGQPKGPGLLERIGKMFGK